MKRPELEGVCEVSGDLFGTTGAAFSECWTWRYLLWRVWDHRRRALMIAGLNPSTADEETDDPTIRRCIDFGKRWGYGGLYMVNLFAFRATDPADMKRAADPIGPANDAVILRTVEASQGILAAWGTQGVFRERGDAVRRLLRKQGREVLTLGLTKNRQPTHPLYIPRDRIPVKLVEV